MLLTWLLFSLLCSRTLCQVCSNGQLRLVGGANQTEGRVEVCSSNMWGTVCDDSWSTADARVVCAQLGYPSGGAQPYSFATFGEGSGPIWLSDIRCSGVEASLQNCYQGPLGTAYCSHQEDAGVACQAAAVGSKQFPTQDVDYLPFISLGTTDGVTTQSTPSLDDGYSDPIYISTNFPFDSAYGIQSINTVYIGTNGYFSFNMGVSVFEPQSFPSIPNLVAPFWADIDITNTPGQILYEVHETNASFFQLARVSAFISTQLGISFDGSWMLVAQYNNVLPFGYTDPTATNTFQGVLITNGSQSYAVYTYKCGLMRWSGHATIGFGSTGSLYKNFPLSRTPNDSSVACLNMPATNWSNLIYPLSDATIQPPLLQIFSNGVNLEDAPVSIYLNASVAPYSIPQSLSIYVSAVPDTVIFDGVYLNGLGWNFGPADFGTVYLNLPQHFVGSVELNATAYNGIQVSYGYLSIYVEPVPTPPNLAVNTPACYNPSDQVISIAISASLVDTNTSEVLYVYISNVTDNITISNLQGNTYNEYMYNATDIATFTLMVVGNLQSVRSVNLAISAQSLLLKYGNKAYNNISVTIEACEYCNDGDVRLVGGSNQFEGRVEVCYNNTWGGICSTHYYYYWGPKEASAVCTQLGYFPYDAIAYNNGHFGVGPSIYYLNVDYCDYDAEGLLDCYYYNTYYYPSVTTLGSYSCYYGLTDFAVSCSNPSPEYCAGPCSNGSIQLVGGPSENGGRVEVCIGGCWGTVCGNTFDINAAIVACRQLGFLGNGAVVQYNIYGPGAGPIWLNGFVCAGNESSLLDCPNNYNHNAIFMCTHSNDVGVMCQGQAPSNCRDGDIRLINGQSNLDGTVQICYSKQWGAVCGDYPWTSDTSAANTVCKQLGYSGSNAGVYISNYVPQSTIWGGIHCDARANTLLDCFSSYTIGQQNSYFCYSGAGVVCQGNMTSVCEEGAVQLVGGYTPYEGKVQVCGRGRWGAVCGNNWDSLDAAVVCNQLGYPTLGAIPYSSAYNYQDGLPIWLYNLNCSGNEQQIYSCPVVHVTSVYCDHYNDASVQCADHITVERCTNGKIRLVGGSMLSEGRVEMCYNQQWGTMCGGYVYSSITTYSNVICRQLGYSPYGANVHQYYNFGQGTGGIFLYAPTLLCIGNERTLLDCYHAPIGYHRCTDHSNDIGIQCQATNNNISECTSGSVRLVGGDYEFQGTVEFCIGDTWNTICGYRGNWNETNSLVLCHQLGLKPTNATTYYNSYFAQGHGTALQLQATCTGNETSIFLCPTNLPEFNFQQYSSVCYDHFNDIGVHCIIDTDPTYVCSNGDIQLINGMNEMEGIVQVCYQNQWSTVCGDYAWTSDTSGAITACKQLGFSTGYPYQHFGNNGASFLSNVHCDVRNDRLIDCYHDDTTYAFCYSLGAVQCQDTFTSECEEGAVSLVGGSTPYEGRVQVCGHGVWGTVCSTYWDSLDGSVVCRQLGYGDLGVISYSYYARFGQLFGPIWLYNLNCSGEERGIFNCSVFNFTSSNLCGHYTDPGVTCPAPSPPDNCTDGDVRLVGGSVPSEGRVEMCYKGLWGTICGLYGDIPAYSNVICRQLGYSPYGASVYRNGQYGQGSGGIFLSTTSFLCIGNEMTLLDCFHPTVGYQECDSHSYDLGLACQVDSINISQCASGEVRLAAGSTSYEGRVEFCIGDTWTTICALDALTWDSLDATVLCRQFGFQSSDPILIFGGYFGQGTGNSAQISPFCTGGESSIFGCTSNGTNYEHYYDCYSNHNVDLGIRCGNATVLPLNCSDGDIQLIDGDTNLEGRVEVCYGTQWYAVCADTTWITDTSGASIVCQQLGYSPINATPYQFPLFRPGLYDLLLSYVHCDARNNRLIDCSHNITYCYSGFAGVRCQALSNVSECTDGAVQLVGGPTPYEGLVEICGHGSWGSICSDTSNYNPLWTSLDASVVCRQLGLPSIGIIPSPSNGQYGIGSGPVWLYNLRCTGDEEQLFDCPFANYQILCDHSNDVSVVCPAPSPPQNCTNGDIRLVGGSVQSEGRVEMCYNEQWGTICGANGDFTTYSHVICRQLGYSPYDANVYYYATYGQGSGGIYFDTSHLLCTGNETNLLDCYYSKVGYFQCTDGHNQDIGIACQASSTFTPQCESGAVHLVDGSNAYEGRVEYCLGGTWTTIGAYYPYWNSLDSLVVCNQLGLNFSSAVSLYNAYFGQGSGPVLQVQSSCTGNETSLFSCSNYDMSPYGLQYYNLNYNHYNDIGIQCILESCRDGDVRLVNGSAQTVGRVEFCYSNQWRPVYSYPGVPWRTAEAIVVCRQLGYATTGAKVYYDNRYGFGSGQIWLAGVQCSGYETQLQLCQYQPNGYYQFSNYYTASMSCQETCNECLNGSIQLTGGSTPYDGRLEVCTAGCWTSVCIAEYSWSAQDAAVACKQLQLSSNGAVPRYYYSKNPIFGLTPQCNGSETSLFQCMQQPCHKGRYNAAGVNCSVLIQPTSTRIYSQTSTLFPSTAGHTPSAITSTAFGTTTAILPSTSSQSGTTKFSSATETISDSFHSTEGLQSIVPSLSPLPTSTSISSQTSTMFSSTAGNSLSVITTSVLGTTTAILPSTSSQSGTTKSSSATETISVSSNTTEGLQSIASSPSPLLASTSISSQTSTMFSSTAGNSLSVITTSVLGTTTAILPSTSSQSGTTKSSSATETISVSSNTTEGLQSIASSPSPLPISTSISSQTSTMLTSTAGNSLSVITTSVLGTTTAILPSTSSQSGTTKSSSATETISVSSNTTEGLQSIASSPSPLPISTSISSQTSTMLTSTAGNSLSVITTSVLGTTTAILPSTSSQSGTTKSSSATETISVSSNNTEGLQSIASSPSPLPISTSISSQTSTMLTSFAGLVLLSTISTVTTPFSTTSTILPSASFQSSTIKFGSTSSEPIASSPSPLPTLPADTTPPSLTFLVSPQYSNSSILISWVFDKEATTQCTLITPTSVLYPSCDQSFSTTNLTEGIYALIITATNANGITAHPVVHTWTVDLTPPVVLLTSYPSPSSYNSMWNFTFHCINEWTCNYQCSFEPSGTADKYVACDQGYFIEADLQTGQDYAFSVFAIDGVGNIGNPVVYSWKFSTADVSTPREITNQQLNTVYASAAGVILAVIIIFVIIIAAICGLLMIKRKSRRRVIMTAGLRSDSSQAQKEEQRTDKDKILLEEMNMKESADVYNNTVFENEIVTSM